MVPPELKNLNDVKMFKSQIRKWEPTKWKCKLYLPYLQNVDYVSIRNYLFIYLFVYFFIYLFIYLFIC